MTKRMEPSGSEYGTLLSREISSASDDVFMLPSRNYGAWASNPSVEITIEGGESTSSRMRWRLVDRSSDFYQSNGSLNVVRLNKSRALYFRDIFHTLVDSPLRTVFFIFCSLYLLTILVFAIFFMAVSDVCELNLRDFNAAWAFSTETIMTIGFGYPGKDYFQACTSVVAAITAESLLGVVCDAVAVGLVFQRLSRAQTRASTIIFSRFACIRKINGTLRFMFQVAEMRKHQLVECHIRCYAISRHKYHENSPVAYFRTNAMRLTKPDDELGGMLFMALPNMVVHDIDSFSPLNPNRENRDTYVNSSCTYAYPDILQRDADTENGSREMKNPENVALPDPPNEASIQKYFEDHRMEILVLLEGIDAVTSDTIQARHSYIIDEIKFNHEFVPCCIEKPDTGKCIIDFNRFHTTIPEAERNWIFSQP